MFEKTFSFWRRLVGKTPASQESATQDDRRLWVRYATELQGNLQHNDGEKVLAKVRDLSLGGANLLVERAVQAGQMVTLELPAEADEVRTVLACVVRVTPQTDGKSALGCVFAHELASEDLSRFGGEQIPSSDDGKRTWIRFSCDLKASYRKVGDPANQSLPAQVLNISANGVGLSVAQPLTTGSLLNVDLLDKTGQVARTMLTCIVHTKVRASGDFAVGCNFIRELSEQELQSLV